VADLDHALQTDKLLLIDFVATQQFGVVAKVAQEPYLTAFLPFANEQYSSHYIDIAI